MSQPPTDSPTSSLNRRGPISGAPSETAARLSIPRTVPEILNAIEIEQHLYEMAKGVVGSLEEQKLDLTEEREHILSGIRQFVSLGDHASAAAADRAEKAAIAGSAQLAALDKGEKGVRRALIRATEDVSVFRHRTLTLRAALRAFGGEEKD